MKNMAHIKKHGKEHVEHGKTLPLINKFAYTSGQVHVSHGTEHIKHAKQRRYEKKRAKQGRYENWPC